MIHKPRSDPKCLLLFVLLLPFIVGISVHADDSIVRFGVYQNPPQVFTAEDGRASGIFIDVLEYVADKEDWTIQYVAGDWTSLLDQLKRGEIDLIGAIAYTEARSTQFDFSAESVITNWGQIYTRTDAKIASILELEGKTLAVLEGDTHAEAAKNLLERFGLSAHLIEVEDYPSVLRALQRGEADAGVVNRLAGIRYAEAYDVRETSIIFNPVENHYASTKGVHQDLLAALDAHLQALKADDSSAYYQSIDRWFGGVSRWQIPEWMPRVGLALAGLLVAFAAASLVLKVQVRAKTQRLQAEITERKRAEESLRISNERLIEAQRIAGIGNWEFDLITNTLCWSDEIYRLFGLEPQQSNPTYDAFLDAIHPDDRALVDNAYSESVRNRAPYDIVHRLLLKDGTLRYVHERCETDYDDTDKAVRSVGTIQDITERVQVEKELTEYREHLEELIEERTAELGVAKERAESADRVKSAFLATMSHELRTPLNSIIGFTGILLQGLPGPLNDEQEKQLSMVQRSSRHLLSLINDVLDISKIEAGEMQVTVGAFAMQGSFESVVASLMPQVDEKGLVLETRIASNVGMVYSDRGRVEQILTNLVGNAIKFTEEGEIGIECETKAGQIVIRVRDTGIGISPEDIEKLFVPFAQLRGGPDRPQEGTGLGLAISKRLTELLGGEIRAESEGPGRGSVFTFELPLESPRR